MGRLYFTMAIAVLAGLPQPAARGAEARHADVQTRDADRPSPEWSDLAETGSASGRNASTWVRPPAEAAPAEAAGAVRIAESFEDFVSGGSPAPAGFLSQTVARAGWWSVQAKGSRAMIGEYQDLRSSPFWELDRLCTDGVRTDELTITGTDREGTEVRWNYTGPELRADVAYDRYIHNLLPDPLDNFPLAEPDPGNPGSLQPVDGDFVAEDLNAGADYAIRVQQLKASFRGDLPEGLRWRLNVWGQRKSGERQVTSLANCFDHPQIAGDARQCHLLSRRQQIDWLTTELEPVLEGKWGALTVVYSRTMRSFRQSDEPLSRLYNSFPAIYQDGTMPPQLGSENFPDGSQYPDAIVPENFTQIDKLRIGLDVTDARQLVGLVYFGNTENLHRDIERDVGGFDVRWIDHAYRNAKWTAFVRMNWETNQSPTALISGEELTFDRFDETEVPCTWSDSRQYGGCGCEPIVVPCVVGEDGVPDFFARDALVPLIDYTRTAAGWNGRWTPFRGQRSWKQGLAFYGGYEYRWLYRTDAVYEATLGPAVVVPVEQPATRTHFLHAGASQRWSRTVDTFLRYKHAWDSLPQYGVRGSNGTTNSSLPTQTDLIEIGGTWSPAYNLMATATLGIQNRSQHSAVANFDEDSYPLTVTLWYAPAQALSFSTGYAWSTNWIQQDITLGDDFADGAVYAPVTRTWNYGGRNEVWSLGARYAWTRNLRLRADARYVRGHNAIASTVFDEPYAWPEIAARVQDDVDWVRLSAGFDHQLAGGTFSYFRYSYLDYGDDVRPGNDGSAHLFLAGLSRRY